MRESVRVVAKSIPSALAAAEKDRPGSVVREVITVGPVILAPEVTELSIPFLGITKG